MSYWEALLLGLVQGLGEFLPISSSAHLAIFPWALGWQDPGLTLSVALHFGTLIAIIAYFYKDWLQIFAGSFRYLFKRKTHATKHEHANNSVASSQEISSPKQSFQLLVYLVLATIPAAILGLLLEEVIEEKFRGPFWIGLNMIIFGILLGLADFWRKSHVSFGKLGLVRAVAIGFSQALALFPGVSRSGATMTAALFLGLDRTQAARFSFLLATPIIFGAALLKLNDFLNSPLNLATFVAIAVSGVVGFLSIHYLMRFVARHGYWPYVIYRFLFGALVFLKLWFFD